MNKIVELSNKGTRAVKALREKRLVNGLPFMINTSVASYLEYPDGSIFLIKRNSSGLDFEKIRELTSNESLNLKNSLRFT